MLNAEIKYKSAMDRLSSHVIGIRVETNYVGDPQTYISIGSSFVLEIEEEWFLITAGHFLSEIEEAKEKYGAKIEISLIDGLSSKRTSKIRLPYPYGIESTCALDYNGYDYGILPIDYITKGSLQLNGVTSLSSDCWNGVFPSDSDYYLLGIPYELFSKNNDGSEDIGQMLLTIERYSECPKSIEMQKGLSFFGKIVEELEISSIKGMSGGPIFAIAKTATGEKKYWLAALQSRWHPEAKEVAGCLVKPLAIEILKTITEVQNKEL